MYSVYNAHINIKKPFTNWKLVNGNGQSGQLIVCDVVGYVFFLCLNFLRYEVIVCQKIQKVKLIQEV